MTDEMTLEEYWQMKRSTRRGNKYNARKCIVDGVKFDSQAEARRYAELKLLRAQGHIAALRIHPRYELQEAFRDSTGKKHRAIHYEADFEYQDGGQTVVEDVKGGKATQTAVFRLKRKLFLYRYQDHELRIVER